MPRNHSILIGAVFILCFPLFVAKAQQPSITQKPVRRVHEQILTGDYQRWLDEDVRWIITDQERADYQSLKTDQQRDQFVESFWTRRDPTPGTLKNEFKEEHYRRIAYANTHFPERIPGWKTDRGHIYIVNGQPDRIESHPATPTRGELLPGKSSSASPHPHEVWHYRSLKGTNPEMTIRFVDKCRCGTYQMEINRGETLELP